MAETEQAFRAAERLVLDCGPSTLPVKPEEIAIQHNIQVGTMPPSSNGGVSGMLIRAGESYGILYATHIENEGFQHFSIGHELGHYFLPGHVDAVVQGGIHQSYAHFRSDNKYEREADSFATGLLMPRHLFDPEMERSGEGFSAIKHLSERCGTSLTSTAIQYIRRASEPAAIVISTGNLINYAFLSEILLEYPDVRWLRKNSPLPNTLTRKFNSTQNNILDTCTENQVSDFQDWFDSPVQGTLLEEVIGLGDYGKTLTVLTASDLPSLEDLEEDGALAESWTPRFKR